MSSPQPQETQPSSLSLLSEESSHSRLLHHGLTQTAGPWSKALGVQGPWTWSGGALPLQILHPDGPLPSP